MAIKGDMGAQCVVYMATNKLGKGVANGESAAS